MEHSTTTRVIAKYISNVIEGIGYITTGDIEDQFDLNLYIANAITAYTDANPQADVDVVMRGVLEQVMAEVLRMKLVPVVEKIDWPMRRIEELRYGPLRASTLTYDEVDVLDDVTLGLVFERCSSRATDVGNHEDNAAVVDSVIEPLLLMKMWNTTHHARLMVLCLDYRAITVDMISKCPDIESRKRVIEIRAALEGIQTKATEDVEALCDLLGQFVSVDAFKEAGLKTTTITMAALDSIVAADSQPSQYVRGTMARRGFPVSMGESAGEFGWETAVVKIDESREVLI